MKTLEIKNCIQCPNHKIVRDPEPGDSFCADDVAVLCKKMLPDKDDSTRYYDNMPFEFKPITCSCRPYNIEKETSIPDWCPLMTIKEESKLETKKELVKLFSAKEARERSESIESENNQRQLATIKAGIEKSIECCETKLYVHTSISEVNMKYLAKLGYKIDATNSRNGSTFTISW